MMIALTAAVHLLAADPAGYARPDLLVRAADLAKPGAAEKFHVLDVRSADKYEAGHVPGAVRAPLSKWSKAATAGTADAAFWKAELAAVGVTPKKPVLVYGDDVRDACRGWWLVALAGVPDVRLLDGGWAAYAAAGGPAQKEPNAPKADPHDWKPAADRQAGKADVLRMVEGKKEKVIDARSADEFRAGRVPGAVHLEWSELIDEKTQTLKPAEKLARLFRERNIDPAAGGCTY